ncbi:MAG: flagellin [Ignavibacteria bacterium]
MRISDTMLTNSFLLNMNNTKELLQTTQRQIATGSKLNKPSDSPSAMSRALRLQTQISNGDMFVQNIANSRASLQTTVSTMESVQTEVQNISILLTNANNPVNKDNLSSFADRIDMSLKSLLDLANTQFDGKYVFGGTDFTTKPYDFSATTVLNTSTNQQTTPVMQNVSTDGIQNVRISTNIIQKVNITGSELFGNLPSSNVNPPVPDVTKTDIFNTLVRVRDGFKNGQRASDADTKIINDFNTKVLDKLTTAGQVQNRMDFTTELLNNQQVELKTLLSKDKDVDVASAVMNLQNYQSNLDLSYKMSSMILPKSLLNYL